MGEAPDSEQRQIDRRQALKRAAAIGVAAWTIPVVQTINMKEALAAVGSPGETCYTIKIDGGCTRCSSPSAGTYAPSAYPCLYQYDSDLIVRGYGRCPRGLTWRKDSSGKWYVTLPSGCYLVAGFSKGGTKCAPSPTPNGSFGTITFVKPTSYTSISNVQLTFCCRPLP